jgi:two-component system chemotaxis response regulator CheB
VKKPVPDFSEDEVNLIKEEMKSFEKGYESDQRSVLTCPDCGGVLWELKDGQLVRYRCHTGHIFNAESLMASYDKVLEKAFWTALRVLVEKAAISNRLAVNARERGNSDREAYFLAIAAEAEEEANRIRESWFNGIAVRSKDESAGEQANDEITRSEK